MAVSLNSYLPRPDDSAEQITVNGEKLLLQVNYSVYSPGGKLKGNARFSANTDTDLFNVRWSKMMVRCLSYWRLVVTKATDDRVASFSRDTAENLGSNGWEVVQEVVGSCMSKFEARLMSMSSKQIIFAHEDRRSADKMKDSNEMVDILNTLLADVEFSFRDILVDWDVTVKPVSVSLSSHSVHSALSEEPASILLTDGDSPNAENSSVSQRLLGTADHLSTSLAVLLEKVTEENKKTRLAVERVAADNVKRHRILCHKVEELKTSLRGLKWHMKCADLDDDTPRYLSGQESDPNFHTDVDHAESTRRVDSIPSVELFESASHDPSSSRSKSLRGEASPAPLPVTSRSQTRSATGSQDLNTANNMSTEDTVLSRSPPTLRKQMEPHSPTSPTLARSSQAFQHLYDSSSQSLASTTRLLTKDDTLKPSETVQDSLSGSDLENRNLDEAVERAYRHDDVPPPKAKSYYTMLCLDTSASMKEHGAAGQLKDVVETFLSGVEDIVAETGVEENIGVVTFGGTSIVRQNLTNDFGKVRDVLDDLVFEGRSPFVQALLVSMAAFVDKAGIISVSGVYDVKPRIIFISDGYPTENHNNGELDVAFNQMHVRTGVTRLMMKFNDKEKYSKFRPIVYIPVGDAADKELMKSMASLSGGEYMEADQVQQLCSYFMLQETIGKTLACLKGKQDNSDRHVEALATGLMPNLSPEQKLEVVEKVQQEQKSPTKKRKRHKSDLEVYEDTEKVKAGVLLPLGTRVVRGPNWHWSNQDGNGPGTVFSYSDKEGWTWVAWDAGGFNRYQYSGLTGDIVKADLLPRLMDDEGDLKIGMTVEKGPNWDSSDEKLQNVQTGIVIRKSRSEKKLVVRWDNGEMQVVRWGADDKYDVSYCYPWEVDKPFTPKSTFQEPSPEAVNKRMTPGPSESDPEPENGRWQWKHPRGVWEDYCEKTNSILEKNYKRKKDGSCVITRKGIHRRVMFKRLTEKEIDSGIECAVRRV